MTIVVVVAYVAVGSYFDFHVPCCGFLDHQSYWILHIAAVDDLNVIELDRSGSEMEDVIADADNLDVE